MDQSCLTQWNYEPCHVGPPKTDRSWWRVLTKCGWLEKGMTNHFSILALRTLNSMKRQKDRILEDELPRLVGAQYATGDQWRNNSRKNEGTKPEKKHHHPAVDVTGDGSKAQCYKEQYCIGTWNVRSINQGKSGVVKQDMARDSIDILAISELKWTRMGEFNSADHISTIVGKNPLEDME